MTDTPLISYEQLRAATGCKTRESLEKILRGQKVSFLYGAGGKPFTTLTALDAAMGLTPVQPEKKEIEFSR
jgi:hypothetical protein